MKTILSHYLWWISLTTLFIIADTIFDKLEIFPGRDSDHLMVIAGLLIIMNICCKILNALINIANILKRYSR